MKSYYDILEIDRSADERQIKSAYFKLVRKYPPERFPEEFKRLRAAYETLSDDKAKKEYDSIGDLPYEAAFLLTQAQNARREHRYADATGIIKMVVGLHPEITAMKVELARAYEDEEKTGNAIKIWEELCKSQPNNTALAMELALSYKHRGWRKKAIETLERILTIDSGYAHAWVLLIECHDEAFDNKLVRQLTFKALEAVTEFKAGDTMLFAYALKEHMYDGDEESAKACLRKAVEVLRNASEFSSEEFEGAFMEILEPVLASGYSNMFPYLQEIYELIQKPDDKLSELFARARMKAQVNLLKEEGYPAAIHCLLETVLQGCDCEECANDMLSMEASILYDLQGYRPFIARLKNERSELYMLHSVFFGEVLTTRYPEKLFTQRIRRLAREGFQPQLRSADGVLEADQGSEYDYEDVPVVTTYRREGPKVGRNDPCPCGSGKKYKKCCGA